MKITNSARTFLTELQKLDTNDILACIDFANHFVHNIVNKEFPNIILEENELRARGILKDDEKYDRHALNQPGSSFYFVKYQKFLGYADIGLSNLKKLVELRFVLFALDEVIPGNQDKKRQFASKELSSYMCAIDTLQTAAIASYNTVQLSAEYIFDENENQEETRTSFAFAVDAKTNLALQLDNEAHLKSRCQDAKLDIENPLALRSQKAKFAQVISTIDSQYEFLFLMFSDNNAEENVEKLSSYDDYIFYGFKEKLEQFKHKFETIIEFDDKMYFLEFATTLEEYINIHSKKSDKNNDFREIYTVVALLERIINSDTDIDAQSCVDILKLKKNELVFNNLINNIKTIINGENVVFGALIVILQDVFQNIEDIHRQKTLITLLTHLYRLLGMDYAQAIGDINNARFQSDLAKLQGCELIREKVNGLIKDRQTEDFNAQLAIIQGQSAKDLMSDISISNEVAALYDMLNPLFISEMDIGKRMQLIEVISEIAKLVDSNNAYIARDRVINALATSGINSIRKNFIQLADAIQNLVKTYGNSIGRFIEEFESNQNPENSNRLSNEQMAAIGKFHESYCAYAQKEFVLIKVQGVLYENFKNEPIRLKEEYNNLLRQLPGNEAFMKFYQEKNRYFNEIFQELNVALENIQIEKNSFEKIKTVLQSFQKIIQAVSSYCIPITDCSYNNKEMQLIYQTVLQAFGHLLSKKNKKKLGVFITEMTKAHLSFYDSLSSNERNKEGYVLQPLQSNAETIISTFMIDREKITDFNIVLDQMEKSKFTAEKNICDALDFQDYLSMGYFAYLSDEIAKNFIAKEFKSNDVIPSNCINTIEQLLDKNADCLQKMPQTIFTKLTYLMRQHNQKASEKVSAQAQALSAKVDDKPHVQATASSSSGRASANPSSGKWLRRLIIGVIACAAIIGAIAVLGTPIGWTIFAGVLLWGGLLGVDKGVSYIPSLCKPKWAAKNKPGSSTSLIITDSSEIVNGPINSSLYEVNRQLAAENKKSPTKQTQSTSETGSDAKVKTNSTLDWLSNKGSGSFSRKRTSKAGCLYQSKPNGKQSRSTARQKTCQIGG